jgi:hypothetical protein
VELVGSVRGGGKTTGFWWGCLKEREFRRPRHRWEDSINIGFKERGGRMRAGLIWLRTGIFAGCCEGGNESSGFMI